MSLLRDYVDYGSVIRAQPTLLRGAVALVIAPGMLTLVTLAYLLAPVVNWLDEGQKK